MLYLSLIIPAFNEGDRMASTLETVEAYLRSLGRPFEIIAVDDGSGNGTLQVMRNYAGCSEAVRVISYEQNRGKGYAVRRGMLASHGEYVAFTDADLSAPIDELDKLIAAVEQGSDIAIGSRAVRGSELLIHQPKYRELGGRALNAIIRALAVRGIHDTQCGLKLFRGDSARRIFEQCFIDGWGFDIEVLYLARCLGLSIAEIPVKWAHSADSKIHPFLAGFQVLRDIYRIRAHNYNLNDNQQPADDV